MARENETSSTKQQGNGNEGGRSPSTGNLANRSHEVAEDMKHAALDRVESVRASAQSAKERAAGRVRQLSATVRKVGEHLRVEDQRYIAEKASDASQKLDGVASYLSSAELSTMMRDTSALARRNPGLFFGGAFVVGIAAGRFLKGGASAVAAAMDEPTSGVQRLAPPSAHETPRSGAAR